MTDSDLSTPRRLIDHAEAKLMKADLAYGQGTSCAADDAAMLVLHVLNLGWDCEEQALDVPLEPQVAESAMALVDERIRTRKPAAYLTGKTWFCGLEFEVSEHVLIPRSPIAELIEATYSPWLPARETTDFLEIGTGSGCIAIATAAYVSGARVDATDCSSEALAIAARNLQWHGLEDAVTLIQTDVWPDNDKQYDVIVSNPPYVPSAEVKALPAEFHHEPAGGLDGGEDGLDFAHRLLRESFHRLKPGGVLIVEVGAQWGLLEVAYPELPFLWLEFERGGEGVFLLERQALEKLAGAS